MEAEIKSRHEKIKKTEKKYKKNYDQKGMEKRDAQEARNWMEKWDKMNKFTFRKKLDEIYVIQQVCQDKFGKKACPVDVTQDWMDDRGKEYRNKFRGDMNQKSYLAVQNASGKGSGGRGSYMGGGRDL